MATYEQLMEVLSDGGKNPVKVEVLDPGKKVYCDDCGEDYTGSDKTGGILFQSKAICPDCSDKWIARAKQYGEEQFIRARCPHGMSFYDWVIKLRCR